MSAVDDIIKARTEPVTMPAPAASAPSLRDAIDAFERQAATTVPGAPSRAQKQSLFEVPEKVRAAYPDAHFKWVSPSKAEQRKNEGYVVISEAEGGKRIGNDHILMGMPAKRFSQVAAAQKQRTEERLVAHKGEMQTAAESVARELRDRHGIKVSAEHLLSE